MDPRQALRELVDRRVVIDLSVRGVTSEPTRESAVLILFGRLDEIPAETGAISLPAYVARGSASHNASASRNGSELSADLDVLLLRRAENMRYHPGQIAFPGGGVDAGDNDAASAALREAEEETGLNPAGVEVVGELPRIPLAVSGNIVTPVVGWWARPSEIAAVDRTEAAQVFRAPVAELLDPDARGTVVLHHTSQTFTSPAFKLGDRFGGHIVWGFTAMVLSQLFDELGWTLPWDDEREFPRPI